jgi:hypothetical protein
MRDAALLLVLALALVSFRVTSIAPAAGEPSAQADPVDESRPAGQEVRHEVPASPPGGPADGESSFLVIIDDDGDGVGERVIPIDAERWLPTARPLRARLSG